MQDQIVKPDNNLIEQDHRSVKFRLGPMLGLKHFRQAATTIAGIDSCIGSGRVSSNSVDWGTKGNTAPKIWNAVLAA
jgi:transposase-like protein